MAVSPSPTTTQIKGKELSSADKTDFQQSSGDELPCRLIESSVLRNKWVIFYLLRISRGEESRENSEKPHGQSQLCAIKVGLSSQV